MLDAIGVATMAGMLIKKKDEYITENFGPVRTVFLDFPEKLYK